MSRSGAVKRRPWAPLRTTPEVGSIARFSALALTLTLALTLGGIMLLDSVHDDARFSALSGALDIATPAETPLRVESELERMARQHAAQKVWLTCRKAARSAVSRAPRDEHGGLIGHADRLLGRLGRCCAAAGQVATVDRELHPEGWRSRLSDVWSCEDTRCPRCAARERAKRAEVLSCASEQWRADGGRVLLATLTVRHVPVSCARDLGALYSLIQRAWSEAIGGLRRESSSWRLVRYERVIEETVREGGRWHPHCHAALLVPGGLPLGRARDIQATLGAAWVAAVVGLDASAKPGRFAVRVSEHLGGVGAVGAYVWGLGAEVHGAASGRAPRLKRGHARDSGDDGEASWGVPVIAWAESHVDDWLMWCRATAGRRMAQGSMGFATEKARLATQWRESHPEPEVPALQRLPVANVSRSSLEWVQDDVERWSRFRRACDRGPAALAAWLVDIEAPPAVCDGVMLYQDHDRVSLTPLVVVDSVVGTPVELPSFGGLALSAVRRLVREGLIDDEDRKTNKKTSFSGRRWSAPGRHDLAVNAAG